MDYKVCNHVILMPMLSFTPMRPKYFFLLEKICYRAGSKETFLKMETLSVKAKAYSCKRKTISMNFKNATISLLWYYYGNTVILIPF